MKNMFLSFLFLVFSITNCMFGDLAISIDQENLSAKKVYKRVLDNGMTVLILQNKDTSNVATFLGYKVGAKDEGIGERGMAHFIEHMIFKGTEEMLSETDIGALSTKLFSYVNAMTWYDFTGYVFKLPSENWDKILPVYADCMQHCRFQQDHMDSEIKAVVQELDMRHDSYQLSLFEAMSSVIFDTHPYHYQVIGFKQDLCRLKQDTLVKFYKKYYIPQHATLVVVGNVDPEQAFKKISDIFSGIARGNDVPSGNFYFNEDIQAKSVTLYRDIAQPIGALAFVIPGLQDMSPVVTDVLETLLADGMNSRLYKKLVDELQLVVSINSGNWGTFEKNIFYIYFIPKQESDIVQINKIILEEIQNIIVCGVPRDEWDRTLRLYHLGRQHRNENIFDVARDIALSHLAQGNGAQFFDDYDNSLLYENVMDLLSKYFRTSVCHEGKVLSFLSIDKDFCMQRVQNDHDLSAAMLAEKQRESTIELPRYAETVSTHRFEKKELAKPEKFTLKNGLDVLLYYNDSVDIVRCALSCKTNYLYDTEGMEGIGYLASEMLLEGTNDLPGSQFAQEIGTYGISFATSVGMISGAMLSPDLLRGLSYLKSMVVDGQFDQDNFEKIKAQQLANIKRAGDSPRFILIKTMNELLYKNHPYSKLDIGTEMSVMAIDRDTCFNFYKKQYTPHGACLVIVGKYNKETIAQSLEDIFASWTGDILDDISYPEIQNFTPECVDVAMNRDQIYLGFFAPSVSALDDDYDALCLYDVLLLKGFDSYLMRLREQTGIFYAVGGSCVQGANKQPGMVQIRTMVAPDRVQEAQQAFISTLTSAVDLITDEEFSHAKEQLIYSYFESYELNEGKAKTFLSLHYYGLSFDYYEKQIDAIRSITKEKMQCIVKKYITPEKIGCVRVGTL